MVILASAVVLLESSYCFLNFELRLLWISAFSRTLGLWSFTTRFWACILETMALSGSLHLQSMEVCRLAAAQALSGTVHPLSQMKALAQALSGTVHPLSQMKALAQALSGSLHPLSHMKALAQALSGSLHLLSLMKALAEALAEALQ